MPRPQQAVILTLCEGLPSSYISLHMSALEVIEQIKALPPAEKAQVVDFVRKMQAEMASETGKTIHYASPDEVKLAGNRVVKQYESVFRRLAE